MTPEQQARKEIDGLLAQAGWHVCDYKAANIHAARGVAIREFPLDPGHGEADYLLYIDGKAAGIVEAKKQGATLTGVERQSEKYIKGLPASLPAWSRPLPFAYESTGIETRIHEWIRSASRALPRRLHIPPARNAGGVAEGNAGPSARRGAPEYLDRGPTFLARMQNMPPLITEWGDHKFWPAQIIAIQNLEKSLAANKPRALIQMATGSGKTFTAINFGYRLIKFAARAACSSSWTAAISASRPRRSSSLRLGLQQLQVRRGVHRPAARQQRPRPDGQGRASARSSACTRCSRASELSRRTKRSRRLASNPLQGSGADRLQPQLPIETFDFIVIDECHRSIYNLWRAGARVLRRLPHRPHRDAEQADVRFLQPRTS